jgi:PPOX class probable F420-dependent enzyme
MPPTSEQDQLIREQKLAILATLRKDGTPQLTPINYAYRDGSILISTTRERAKYPNLRRDPRVALNVIHPSGHPYVTIYGRARIEEADIVDGTAEIFRRISDRPLPEDFAQRLREQQRVLVIVTPERFIPS